jgi:hypothetical protein
VEVKVGDLYIRRSDHQICKVKRIDNKMIVLELDDENRLTLSNLFSLENAYIRKESQSIQKPTAKLHET